MAALISVIDRARSGEGATALITGEAGVGKSRLVREGMTIARSQGLGVTRAECLVEPDAPPYDVWVRALRSIGSGEAAYLLEGLATPDATTPYSSWRSRKLSADEARFRLMSDLLTELERQAGRRPLLICIDDLQWADPSSLRLFQFVAQRSREAAIGLIGIVRSEEREHSGLQSLTESLSGRDWFQSIELNPLTFDESRQLIAQSLDVGLDRSVALFEHSEGNAFVLEEAIRVIRTAGPSVHPQLPLPSSVAASIRSRLADLDPPDRSLIETGAVAGKSFSLDLVCSVLDEPAGPAQETCERLCQLAILKRFDQYERLGYQFLHDRLRTVVLDDISPERKRDIHLGLATTLSSSAGAEDDPESISKLAAHFRQAGRLGEAFRYYLRLGELSLTRHAPDEATTAFRMALECYPVHGAPLERGSLLTAYGNALLSSGKRGAIDAFLESERVFVSAGSLRASAIAADHAARALAANEEHSAALEAWDRGLDLLEPLDYDEIDLDRATILIHQSEVLGASLGRFDEAMRTQRRALQLLPPGLEGNEGRSEASLALGRTLIQMNRLPDASSVLRSSLPSAVQLDNLSVAAEIEAAIATVCYWQGRLRESRSSTQRRQAFAEAAGDRRSRRHVNAWLGLIEASLGNLDRAEELLDAADEDVTEFDSPEPLAFSRQIRGHVAFVRGDHARAFSLMRQALDTFLPIGPTTALWYVGYAARAAHHAGSFEERDELKQIAWSMLEDAPPHALSRGGTLSHLSLLAVETGDVTRSAQLLDHLEPYAGQLHWFLVDATRASLALQLGRTGLAATLFDAAIAQARVNDLRIDMRLTLKAAAQNQSASDSRRETGPSTALTDREIDVLRLVASGLTNRDIAAQMGIAEKTVRNHVTHILDKLDLDNRAAAAAFAVRHGLA